MVKKVVLFVLSVLLTLSFVGSVSAQDELPWEAEAGGDSATATYHTYANMVLEDPCLLLEFTIGSGVGATPDEIQPFVNRGKKQWVYPIENILPGQATGETFTVFIPFNRMRLKEDGHLSETEYFDPTAGKVSDVGLHLWDPEFEASLLLTRFEVMTEGCVETLIPEGEPEQTPEPLTLGLIETPAACPVDVRHYYEYSDTVYIEGDLLDVTFLWIFIERDEVEFFEAEPISYNGFTTRFRILSHLPDGTTVDDMKGVYPCFK